MRYFIVSYAYGGWGFGTRAFEQEQYPNIADIQRECGRDFIAILNIMELSESDWLDWNRDTEGK